MEVVKVIFSHDNIFCSKIMHVSSKDAYCKGDVQVDAYASLVEWVNGISTGKI